MRFSASYDRTTKIVSATVAGFLLALALALQSVIVGSISVVLLVLAYAFSPRGYTIADEWILIDRLIGNVRVPLRGLREARRSTADDFRGAIRLFGDGGLFGYYGLFRTARLGKSHWYMTNRSNAVVVRTTDRVVVVSPDDPESFLLALHPPPQMADEEKPFSLRTAPPNWMANLAIAMAIGIGAVIIPLAMMYAPGPDTYTLTRNALTIHDRFYPITLQADAIDVGGIRVIDLATDAEWRPTQRTNGFSNSHYKSGWYRVANGQKIRLYRTTGERLVLLPPKGTGTPVLYQPPDLERFLAEVRREWAGG